MKKNKRILTINTILITILILLGFAITSFADNSLNMSVENTPQLNNLGAVKVGTTTTEANYQHQGRPFSGGSGSVVAEADGSKKNETDSYVKGNRSITDLMNFLNDKDFDAGSNYTMSTGLTALQKFCSLFCIRHNQPIGKYHAYLEKNHGGQVDISDYTELPDKYTTIPDNLALDYIEMKTPSSTSEFRKQGEAGNRRDTDVKYEDHGFQNIYRISNGWNTHNTNIFSYAATFSQKIDGGYYSSERAQLGIWAVVGYPGKGDPISNVTENIQNPGNVEEDTGTSVSDTNLITDSELWMAGAALDEYEDLLTKDISGDELAKHNAAVAGTDEKLRNKPEVTIFANAGSDEFVDNTEGEKVGSIEDSTGTTIFEENGKEFYKIGPFQMSNYALASAKDVGTENYIEKYSGEKLTKYKDMLGGIIYGEVVFEDEGGNKTATLEIGQNKDSQVQIVYTDMNNNPIYTENEFKTFEISANYVRTPLATDEEPYVYPYPTSKFYVVVSKDACGTDTVKLADMTFEYRQTKTDGHGWVITSQFVRTTWEIDEENASRSNCTYDCQTCDHDGLSYSESKYGDGTGNKTHIYYCDSTNYCSKGEYGWHRHCGGDCRTSCIHICNQTTCDNGDGDTDYTDGCIHSCSITPSYCVHGFRYGNHANTQQSWGGSAIIHCTGTTICDHSHEKCYKAIWKETDNAGTNITGQPFLAIHDAQVWVIKTPVTSELDIRMTTDVSVNKYIYDVEHAESDTLENSEHDSTQNATNEKGDFEESQKQNNPTYVEVGDTITYHVDLVNAQGQDVMVRIRDILPDGIQLLSVKNTDTSADSLEYTDVSKFYQTEVIDGINVTYLKDAFFTTKWIKVAGNSTTTIEIKVRVVRVINDGTENGSTSWENKASIITRNEGHLGYPSKDVVSVDYVRTDIDARPGPVVNLSDKLDSSDWYKLKEYKASVYKVVSAYNEEKTKENNNNPMNDNNMKITEEVNNSSMFIMDGVTGKGQFTRYPYSEEQKANTPIFVEKGETLSYSIIVANESEDKPNTSFPFLTSKATQVRPTEITDVLQKGLYLLTDSSGNYQVTATMYNEDGTVNTKYDSLGSVAVKVNKVKTDSFGTEYTFEIGNETILNPGDYMIYTVNVGVEQSNMYLHSLENSAELTKLTNINHLIFGIPIYIKDEKADINEGQEKSADYVRMKDLVISGRVWLDRDKDGLMDLDSKKAFDGAIDVESKPSSNIQYSGDVTEKALKNVVVNLYTNVGNDNDDTNDVILRTTKTDENGIFTFGKDESGQNWRPGEYNISSDGYVTESEQRIPKADKKDPTTKKYAKDSVYYQYYVEYEYDGVLYKSTELYAGMDNLDNVGNIKSDKYYIDSNAKELTEIRENFNKKYEFISYNVAYPCDYDDINNPDLTDGGEKILEFSKEEHNSYLKIDPARTMRARSFIIDRDSAELQRICSVAASKCTATKWKSCSNHWDEWKVAIDAGLIDPSAYTNDKNGREQAKKALKDILNNLTDEEFVEMTKYLWLYPFNNDTSYNTPETDYLKYINLGLQEREEIDISLMKDIYEVKTTINGEEMIYSFDQLEAEGPEALNGEIGNSTGKYLQDYVIKEPYGITLYEEDFKYRYEQYQNQEVQNYKGPESELNIEVTYKITVDSKDINNDNRTSATKNNYDDVELSTRVHEILDIYDENFIKVFDNSGNLAAPINVKEKYSEVVNAGIEYEESVDLLRNKPIQVAEAWCYDENNNKVMLTLSNESSYYETNNSFTNKDNNFTSEEYNTLYITGMDDVNMKINEGGKLDIFVKYIIDKTPSAENIKGIEYERLLKVFDKSNTTESENIESISQVNAYSVWYTESGKPASIVDCDSNVGNISILDDYGSKTEVDNFDFYEDTMYKADIKFTVPNTITPPPPPTTPPPTTPPPGEDPDPELIRKMTGFVWDDARSTENAGQYLGNGEYNTSDTKHNDAKNNEAVRENYLFYDNSSRRVYKTEDKDILVRNAKVEYIEIIPIVENGEVKYYEDKIDGTTWNAVQNTRSGEDGSFELTGYIPGYYVVRYTYGDKGENITNAYELDASTGELANRDAQDMLVFNGQDYKSTKYNDVTLGVAVDDNYYNEILLGLEAANKSDARDDELKRLETISYSEVMVNSIAEVLKGYTNGTIRTEDNEYGKDGEYITPNNFNRNSEAELATLTENTYMYADTTKFYVKPEKLDKLTTVTSPTATISYAGITSGEGDILYEEVNKIEFEDTTPETRIFTIKNLDFGLEYRPESQISLNKRISKVTLIPSGDDKTPLVKLVFDVDNTATSSTVRTNIINEAESIGFENVQFISNKYKNFGDYLVASELENEQGFVFINIDEDILQGCTLEIEYEFTAGNEGEIDRINSNLDAIRFKQNADAVAQSGFFYIDNPSDENYRASRTAANVLRVLYGVNYTTDKTNPNYKTYYPEIKYTTKVKRSYVATNNGTTISETGYYGKYLSEFYYTGVEGEKDVISTIKFDKILDYVDTDLVFKSDENLQKLENNTLWSTTTSQVLKEDGYIKPSLFIDDTIYGHRLISPLGGLYDTYHEGVTDNTAGNVPISSNLVTSVTDRVKDEDEYLSATDDPTINVDISQFLEPEEKAQVRLTAYKIISAETFEEDMSYENIAEIIQFTTLTGRRTNYATTIGNADMRPADLKEPGTTSTDPNGSEEYHESTKEPDTSAVEEITLKPPTGLGKLEHIIKDTVEIAGKGIGISAITVAVIVVVVIAVQFIIRKIRKRRIK